MATMEYPKSDENRIILLESIVKQTARDVTSARIRVPANLTTAIQTFITSYRPAIDLVLELRGVRGREVDEKQTAVDQLQQYVRDFWAVLERRISREDLSRGMFIQYDLLRSGDNPGGRALKDWLKYADHIIKGEAKTIAAGYAPMSNPSAAEVAAKRDAVVAEVDDVLTVGDDLDAAQHALDDARAEADKLIRLTSAQLDIALYGTDNDDVRNVKVRYGYEYYDESAVAPADTEPIAPEEEPAI